MIYLFYDELAEIDYCFLLALYKIAQTNNGERLKNKIQYNNIEELSKKIQANCGGYSISTASLYRNISSPKYKKYFSIDKETRSILLYNDFRTGKAKENKFITISEKECSFLLANNNNLLCKYFAYIKYYCGYNKGKGTDFTAEQFLSAIGYSSKSGNNKQKLSLYNGLLLDNGLVNIAVYRDSKGKKRNLYTIPKQ